MLDIRLIGIWIKTHKLCVVYWCKYSASVGSSNKSFFFWGQTRYTKNLYSYCNWRCHPAMASTSVSTKKRKREDGDGGHSRPDLVTLNVLDKDISALGPVLGSHFHSCFPVIHFHSFVQFSYFSGSSSPRINTILRLLKIKIICKRWRKRICFKKPFYSGWDSRGRFLFNKRRGRCCSRLQVRYIFSAGISFLTLYADILLV